MSAQHTPGPVADDVLTDALVFTYTVERFLRSDLPSDMQPATETEVAEAMYALRSLIAKATRSAS